MSVAIRDSQTVTVCGLGTWTHTVVTAGLFQIEVISDMVPDSSLSITISQTGSTSQSATSTAPVVGQNHNPIRKLFNCAANDVLSAAISSSAAIDKGFNNIHSTIRIGRIG